MITFEGLPGWCPFAEEAISAWLKLIAHHHKCRIESLHYSFLNDAAIAEANENHLAHPYPTDVITFGYKEGSILSGDVLIGHQTVRANAEDLEVNENRELLRVMAHGILHLIGFDDKNKRQAMEMRTEEEKCLILRPKNLKAK